MAIKRQRKRLNNFVKEWGNKKMDTPLEFGKRYGLGDFLTQEVNFRKAGAFAGFLAPAMINYAIDGDSSIYTNLMTYVGTFGIIPSSTGFLGYGLGLYIDKLTENEPRWMRQVNYSEQDK